MRVAIPSGIRATIPAKIKSEIPFPTPLLVIRSPIQTSAMVPAVQAIKVIAVNAPLENEGVITLTPV